MMFNIRLKGFSYNYDCYDDYEMKNVLKILIDFGFTEFIITKVKEKEKPPHEK